MSIDPAALVAGSIRLASGEELDLGSLSIEITNGRIKHYSVDGDSESWGVADFDGVHRTKTTHKVS